MWWEKWVMFEFFFDIKLDVGNVCFIIWLVCLISEWGNKVYYIDIFDFVFIIGLLWKGIGCIIYLYDFWWFMLYLVLLDY